MAETTECSLVVGYTSPHLRDALAIQRLLEADGVRATVATSNEPPSLSAPSEVSEVLVWGEDEARVRMLVEQAKLRHQQLVELQDAGLCDADRQWP